MLGLALQDIMKDSKHLLRPWELLRHRNIIGMRRAKVPKLAYSQVYCFYKVLPGTVAKAIILAFTFYSKDTTYQGHLYYSGQIYSSVLNNRPVTLGPDSLLTS